MSYAFNERQAMTLCLSRRALVSGVAASCFGLGRANAAGSGGRIPPAMARGFNLPGQAPMRADHAAAQETLRALRGFGMTHVRLPVVAEHVLPHFSGPATVSAAMDDVERAVDRLLALDYSVTVDLHPGPDFNVLHRRDPDDAHRALLGGWQALARRMAKWPVDRLFAELLNEPATTDDVWRPFAEKLAAAVRSILPESYILVGPAPFHRVDALMRWRPLADDRVMYVCHFYDPMMFTHQGSSWDTSTPWGRGAGVPFPTKADDPALRALAEAADTNGDGQLAAELRAMAARAWDASAIAGQFTELGRWSAEHSAPVIVNEFGVLKWKARRPDRLAWLAAARAAIEAQGFGWAHWDYASAFGLLNDAGEIDQAVLSVLLPKMARSVVPRVRATSPMTTGSDNGTK